MQILGELMRLPEKAPLHRKLPIPWFHRASLGFSSGSDVHLAYVKPQPDGRPLGDIIASVLRPWDLHKIRRLTLLPRDEVGVVTEVAKLTEKFNIALSETATINGGAHHYIDLFLEPFEPTGPSEAKHDMELLQDELWNRFGYASLIPLIKERQKMPLTHAPLEMAWMFDGVVEDGWIATEFPWRERLKEELGNAEPFVNTNSVVVSSETTRRVLRYIFPLHGAVTFVITGLDIPGGMVAMTSAINDAGLNILSSLIKRGGKKPAGHSTFVAVCEPVDKRSVTSKHAADFISQAKAKVIETLRAAQYHKNQFQVVVNPPQNAQSKIYVRRRYDILVPLDEDIRPRVIDERQTVDTVANGKTPVFIAQRFHNKGTKPWQIIMEARRALDAAGCYPVVALPEPNPFNSEFSWHQVKAKMWVSAACLAVAFEDSPGIMERGAPSLSIAQEFGFMQGQGKPAQILVAEHAISATSKTWFDIQGRVLLIYQDSVALDEDNEHSVFRKVFDWARSLRA